MDVCQRINGIDFGRLLIPFYLNFALLIIVREEKNNNLPA